MVTDFEFILAILTFFDGAHVCNPRYIMTGKPIIRYDSNMPGA